MPIVRPTRQQLLESARAEIEARLAGADARLRRSLLDVTARMLSGQVHALYGFIEYHARQPFPQLADSEWLRRHAELYGVPEIPADFSGGNVTFTGTNDSIVPQGSSVRRGDGREYLTTADATITVGTATAPVLAVLVGLLGDALTGTSLKLSAPVTGVSVVATVASGGLTGGRDEENDESLRARVLARIQQPPAGGTQFDYQAQAKLYPGVTDVFVHTAQFGAGTVGVAPLLYDREDPIPTVDDVAAIQALVTAATFKPLCAQVTTYALTPVPQDFTIHVVPDTTAVHNAVVAEIQALFRREATPGGVILRSHIREAISLAAGETDSTLTTPSADIDLADDLDEISTVGDFTWT